MPLQQKREERGKVRQWIEEKDTLDELIHVCLKAGKKFGISDISAAAHKLARLALTASGNVCVRTCQVPMHLLIRSPRTHLYSQYIRRRAGAAGQVDK